MLEDYTFSHHLKGYYGDEEWQPHILPHINIKFVNGTELLSSPLPLEDLLPQSHISIPEFRENSLLRTIDPFDEWKKISYEGGNPNLIKEYLDDWHYRQFARNWCPNEINKRLLLEYLYGRKKAPVPSSLTETLIACYFVKKKYDNRTPDESKDMNRMESLMSYRPSKYVHDLFKALDDCRNYHHWTSATDSVALIEMHNLDVRESNLIARKYSRYCK